MKTLMALALIMAALPVAAEQTQPPRVQPVKSVGDAQRGEALVMRWCADCHHPRGEGVETDQAPSIHWIAEKTHEDPVFIRTFLNKPHAPMPPLDLTRSEIEDAVAYFAEQGKH